jgi:hypothetical protein
MIIIFGTFIFVVGFIAGFLAGREHEKEKRNGC